jgi:hypothetical protein
MRRSALFFGVLVVLLGAVLLAINLNLVSSAIWRFFWPAVLVLLGVSFILEPMMLKGKMETVDRSIPSDNATDAQITFNYGAGVLNVGASSISGELIGGTFMGGITEDVNRSGNHVDVKLNSPTDLMFPGNWVYGQRGLDWNVRLTKEIPLKLAFRTGACEAKLDLEELKVSEITLETGASSTDIKLPMNAGYTRVVVKSGAASVKVIVPQGVAATFKESSGLSGVTVDTSRFVQNGHTYQSPDYATATNKVDITFEGGVGSIDLR